MTKLIALTPALAGFAVLTFSLITGASPVAAQAGRNGQLHIVKDCGNPANPPSSCQIVGSNLGALPAGSLVYYDQVTGGPSAGPGYLDSNVFVYVNSGQWAVGRCTVANDASAGICTLSDGVGPLAGITTRVNVTYTPGGDGAMFAWDGTYSFNPLPGK